MRFLEFFNQFCEGQIEMQSIPAIMKDCNAFLDGEDFDEKMETYLRD